ncbi:MAG: hypothetical protein K8H88_26115 [Sandaracinaceae bacterium]|nr:hypothetical protein [Sandaracinaceae bacterium]
MAECHCFFVSDQQIVEYGYALEEFQYDRCPDAAYLCCEQGANLEANGFPACECANPASVVQCLGEHPIVPSCP